jgi:transposase
MDTTTSISGTMILKAMLEGADHPKRPKRSRRSWSDDEKRRMVSEALSPGASIADVARQHGVNANLLFNWVRSTRRISSGVASSPLGPPPEPPPPASSCDFIPLGVFTHALDGGPMLLGTAEPAESTKPSSVQEPATVVRAATRLGLIEIELANGTKLQVDSSVDEHALQRVMSVLKATS